MTAQRGTDDEESMWSQVWPFLVLALVAGIVEVVAVVALSGGGDGSRPVDGAMSAPAVAAPSTPTIPAVSTTPAVPQEVAVPEEPATGPVTVAASRGDSPRSVGRPVEQAPPVVQEPDPVDAAPVEQTPPVALEPDPVAEQCPEGTRRAEDGTCVPDGFWDCPAGSRLAEDGTCVPDGFWDCPEGTRPAEDGTCVPDGFWDDVPPVVEPALVARVEIGWAGRK